MGHHFFRHFAGCWFFGFSGVAAGSRSIAKVLFFIALAIFLVILVFGVFLGVLVF